MLFYLAMLPLYLDADGPMYPPVCYSDRFLFEHRSREATSRNMGICYKSYLLLRDMGDLEIAVWHLDKAEVYRLRKYCEWLWCVYDKIDDLAMYENDKPEWYQVEKTLASLQRLRRLLGPINYYRGIVPPVFQVEVMR